MRIPKITKENISKSTLDSDNRQANRMQASFGEHLHKVESSLVHQELQQLLKEIEAQGKKLGESLNLRDLIKFKENIKKYLNYAVRKMYQLKEQTGWNRMGHHKIYVTIETVNKELEELTNMILEEQKDQINVLSKIDHIKGLLIDLYF